MMVFGQKIYTIDGRRQPGRWLPYETREAAVADGAGPTTQAERERTVTRSKRG